MRIARLPALCAAVLASNVVGDCAAEEKSGIANPGFEEGAAGAAPPGWRFYGDGYRAVRSTDAARSGRAGLAISYAAQAEPGTPGSLIQRIDAAAFRNRRIRMSVAASVESEAPEGAGGGHFWVRVDGPEGPVFFDNMQAHPIRTPGWRRYEIEAGVPESAQAIVFGFFLRGRGAARIDNFRIADIGPKGDVAARPLTPRGLDNLAAFARLFGYVRYFHPSDEAAHANWEELALTGVERIEGAEDAEALRDALTDLFAAVAPGMRILRRGERAPEARATGPDVIAWRHEGLGLDPNYGYRSARIGAPADLPAFARLELAGGLVAHVPLRATRGEDGRTRPVAGRARSHSRKPAGFEPTGDDRSSRLAAVVLAWNVFQHFYPYFDVVSVNWPEELSKALRAAATDRDAAAFDATLERLVAALDDGHGAVRREEPGGMLPLEWEWIENALVVTHVGEGAAEVKIGDIVRAIDGRAIDALIAEREELISMATSGHGRWRALSELLRGRPGASRTLSLERAGGAVDVRLAFGAEPWRFPSATRAARPENLSELAPRILYVDLGRVTEYDIQTNMTRLASADAIVFDMRGYPTDAAFDLLRHLSDRPLQTDAFNVPVFTQPDQRNVVFDDRGWPVELAAPRFRGRFVFMTDGRAVSYAETVMGIVEAYRLGEIVGAQTAGTNGNINPFTLPTGHRVAWTGLQVLNRDGSPHHGVGVRPTIPAQRTIAGVRAGRDEVLERALAAARRSGRR